MTFCARSDGVETRIIAALNKTMAACMARPAFFMHRPGAGVRDETRHLSMTPNRRFSMVIRGDGRKGSIASGFDVRRRETGPRRFLTFGCHGRDFVALPRQLVVFSMGSRSLGTRGRSAMTARNRIVVLAALLLTPSLTMTAQAQDILWDNGQWNGIGGASNATVDVFGARRTVLFDFVVPDDETWIISGLKWLATWNTLPPGTGTGMEIRFYDDVGDEPGMPISSVVVSTSYTETATGEIAFGRPMYEAVSTFRASTLSPGRYWTDATVVGPENNFWLTADVVDNPCWVDYADLGGLQPSRDIWGGDRDITGALTGTSSGGGYALSVDGSCPGNLTVAWSGAGRGQQGLVIGNREGSTTIPGGPCSGTVLGVQGQVRLVTPPGIFRTRGGNGSISGHAGQGACGKYLQLVKGGTCNTSNVVQISQ